MAQTPADFFRYGAATPEAEAWGALVTGGGRFAALPQQPYPPAGHPSDHAFSWERGRVLGAFQVVFVAEGTGEFESRATGRLAIGAGSALLLFPGTWHRYRPGAESGWVEKWVEIGGPLVGRLLAEGTFNPRQPVLAITRRAELEGTLDAIQRLLLLDSAGYAPELAAHAVMLLALLRASRQEQKPLPAIASAVEEAKRMMEDITRDPLPMPELARALGVSYSYFRREFRRRTGISPRQYQLRLRMQRAQRLLGASDDSLKQIADRLGFSSAYHLSLAFKAEFGLAPSHWRRRKLDR